MLKKFLSNSFDWQETKKVETQIDKTYYAKNRKKSWQKDNRKNYIYLLLDLNITKKLIQQYENDKNELVIQTTFISAIFYICKITTILHL